MSEKVKPSKDVRFEALRIVACFLVALSHVAEQGEATYSVPSGYLAFDDWMIFNVWNCFSRSGAPLFFMISGSFMLDSKLDIDVFNQTKKLFIKLISWLLFYSLCFYLLYNLCFHPEVLTVSGTLTASLMLPSHLWFVWCLLSMYLITPFLRRIVVDEKLTWYFLGLGALANFVIYQIGGVLRSEMYNRVFNKMDFYFVMGMSFYYVAGFALKRYVDLCNDIKSKTIRHLSIVAFITSWFLAAYIAWRLNAANDPYVFEKTVYSDGFFTTGIETISLFVLFASLKICSVRLKKIILTVSSYTVGVYYIHYGLLFKIKELQLLPLENMNAWQFIVSLLAVVILGSIAITFVMKKIPGVNKMC